MKVARDDFSKTERIIDVNEKKIEACHKKIEEEAEKQKEKKLEKVFVKSFL